MANLNIKITNPTINLISRKKETSTSCESIITFDIQSTPYTDIIVAIDTVKYGDLERFGSIDIGSGYMTLESVSKLSYPSYFPNTENFTFQRIRVNLNSSGKAIVRLIIGNSGTSNKYKTASVLVKDITNNKESRADYTRYNDDPLCETGEAPVAIDDSVSLPAGTSYNIRPLENDTRVSPWGNNEIIIITGPSNGTATIDQSAQKIIYQNSGSVDTTDQITYKFTNHLGESNIATITINIIQPGDPEAPQVTNNTKFFIGFDSSGSMGDVLPILNNLEGRALKVRFESYYDTPQQYEDNVEVLSFKTERFFQFMEQRILENPSKDIICLVFQNESFGDGELNYERFSKDDPLTSSYNTDITNIRIAIDNHQNRFNGVLLEINEYINGNEDLNFTNWLTWVQNGEGNYASDKGISDRADLNIKLNVLTPDELDAQGLTTSEEKEDYYADKIVESLNELGFNIT